MTILNVPFTEKEDAKALGARWNQDLRSWVVPQGLDASLFLKWLPTSPDFNIKAPSFILVKGECTCWKCIKETVVYGIAIESGEQLEDGEWVEIDSLSLLSFTKNISGDLEEKIRKATNGLLYKDSSKTTEYSYLMNHCEKCGAKQGDFGLHHEPDGPFYDSDDCTTSAFYNDQIQAEASVSAA